MLEGDRRNNLLSKAIPQKGLEYEDANVTYLLVTAFKGAGNDLDKLKEGTAKKFYFGNKGPNSSVNLSKVKYLAPIMGHLFTGYYEIKAVKIEEEVGQEYPYRFKIDLGDYHPLNGLVLYGVDIAAARGVTMKSDKFKEYCSKNISPQ